MSAARISPELSLSAESWVTSPVIDYEPVPQPLTGACTAQADLHRPSSRLRRRPRVAPRELPPPRSAVVFAEAALRLVIEVIDRRRPVSQLRRLMTPLLTDCVVAYAAAPRTGSATLRRVRVRAVDGGTGDVRAAEVFATFHRSGRVHAVAGRIERTDNEPDSWRLVALQIG